VDSSAVDSDRPVYTSECWVFESGDCSDFLVDDSASALFLGECYGKDTQDGD
jgi:hypothetical protein